MPKYSSFLLKFFSVLLCLVSATASAHLLKVFAWMEGSQIVGNAYFAGGVTAGGANIIIYDAQKQIIARAKPDDDGSFRISVPASQGYRVEANTGDGHIAYWNIAADEVDTAVDKAEPPAKVTLTAKNVDPAPQHLHEPQATLAVNLTKQQLTQVVQTAVAKEVGPLRMELQQAESRAKLSDIIGGLGFIFGIAGLALWWRGKKL